MKKKLEPFGRNRFLTDDERERLLLECQRSKWPLLHFLVWLALSTGARRSDLIERKWSDFQLWDAAPGIYVPETKNGDSRYLPLTGKCLEMARTAEQQRRPGISYVFARPNGRDGPFRQFDPHWYRALDAAGIEDFRFHDLRHTCASYLASGGASLLEVANVLGHRSLRMTLRYVHLSSSHKRAQLEKMAEERGL